MKFTLASLFAINAIVAVHGRAIPEAQPEAIWDRLVSRFAGSFEVRDLSRHHYGGFPGLNPTGIQGVVPGAGTTGKPTGTEMGPVRTGTRVVSRTGTAVYGTGTGIIIGTHTRLSVFPTGTGIIRSSTSGISSKKPPAVTPKTPHSSNAGPKTVTDPGTQPPPGTASVVQVITSIITATQPPVTVTVNPPAVTVTVVGEGKGSIVASTVTKTTSITVTAPGATVTAACKGGVYNSQT